MPDFSIGVDLGGTNLRVAAVTTDGELLEKITLGVKVALGRDHVIGEMCDAIHRLIEQYRGSGRFVGAGIGVPGIIDMETGMMRMSANLPGWSDYPVRDEIERRLGSGTRVFLDNDAKMAALGEKWMGAGRDVDNMAMLTLGTGIGGAIILNGKIFYGMNGMAGEFGHVTIEPDGVPCGCGNHGCAERYASATAVVRMAREAIESGKAPALAKAANADPEFSARSIYNLALQGNEDAQRIFQRFGVALGMLLADLINIINLEMFVIGGGVVSAWDAFAPSMFAEIRDRSLIYAATAPDDPHSKKEGASAQIAPYTRKKTIITRALLGSDAGLYGAAKTPTS
ncbi:MAG TPA: ROK family protein [Candidatus Sulfotelmatobacter sp.]|jgi:glucokinase|nr:ROK family protein [Candidatus Sulfotelmatobacter sp.]